MSHQVLSISASDRDALARIVQAEAGNQSSVGQQAVLFTVLNRTAAKTGGFPNSVSQVIEQRGQFEPMASRKSWQDLPSARPEIRQLVDSTLAGYAAGNLSDPTSGATFFQNPKTTTQRGTNYAATPATFIEGDHHFYNRYRLNPVVEVPTYSITIGDGVMEGAVDPKSLRTDGFQPSRRSLQAPASRPMVAANGSAFGDAYAAAYNKSSGRFSEGLTDAPASQSGFAAAYSNSLASIGPENNRSDDPTSTTTMRPRVREDGTPFGISMVHDGVSLDGISPAALEAANLAASVLGMDLPVTSGYRSQAKQDRIRHSGDPNRPTVAKHSHHTSTGGGAPTALDISIKGMSTSDQARMVDALAAAGFTGFGFYGTHIHVDMRDAVPSSFNLDKGWGGWTRVPDWASTILRQRGFSAGLPANKIKRGFAT